MTKVADIPSSSNPAKSYSIFEDEAGNFSCTCPDYLIRRRAKGEDCKHIKEYRKALKDMAKEAAQA